MIRKSDAYVGVRTARSQNVKRSYPKKVSEIRNRDFAVLLERTSANADLDGLTRRRFDASVRNHACGDARMNGYEEAYSLAPADALRYGAWRRVTAIGKAQRVANALRSRAAEDVKLLDVGCGDGALLAELAARRPWWSYTGVEVAQAAAEIAARRLRGIPVETYDGERLPWPDGSFDAGVLSHVLEHVADPVAVLREAARVCGLVVVEVPLERNLSARRRAKREHAEEIGHVQLFTRADVGRIVEAAGLERREEATDTLSRDALRFFCTSGAQRLGADAKWLAQRSLHGLAPGLARRAFTVQYVTLCGPPA
jgi:SAM-dependent methyltransferase